VCRGVGVKQRCWHSPRRASQPVLLVSRSSRAASSQICRSFAPLYATNERRLHFLASAKRRVHRVAIRMPSCVRVSACCRVTVNDFFCCCTFLDVCHFSRSVFVWRCCRYAARIASPRLIPSKHAIYYQSHTVRVWLEIVCCIECYRRVSLAQSKQSIHAAPISIQFSLLALPEHLSTITLHLFIIIITLYNLCTISIGFKSINID
jgi:hypothetical protein